MRIVRGLDGAKRVLCDGRGLSLDSVPPQVQERTNAVFGEPLSPLRFVERVLTEVRERGDEAVRDLTRKLDGLDLEAFEVPSSAVAEA